MITQKIIARTDSLKLDKIISRYGEDSMRQVVFIIVRPDPESEELIPITIPEDAVGSFRILKPSGNFVIVPMSKSVLTTGETAFDVVLPASANTAKGSGYYDIRITSDTDKYYFTAQGDFLIDDNIISDEVLEDVSEVNGLIFPDDFLTVEDHVAYIDDDTISTDNTWSSNKINEEIEAHAGGDVSKTVSGNLIEINDAASAPLVKCVTQITGYQSGTGTPSSDNIRPIVAYTEGEIEVRGKNLCNPSKVTHPSSQYIWGYKREGFLFKAGTSYTLSIDITVASTSIYSVDETTQLAYAPSVNRVTYTPTQDTLGVLRFYGATALDFDNAHIQLEIGKSPTTYEPYTSTIHTTTYPSAIYRGSEDVVNGEVTSLYGCIDLGDLDYIYQSINDRFVSTTSVSNMKYSTSDSVPFNGLCSHLPIVSPRETQGGYSTQFGVANGSSDSQLRIRYNGITDPTIFKSTVTGIKLWFELATPTTSSVTPTNLPIKSLSGYTQIESSTGDMEVEYITQRFQPLIDSIKQL